MSEIKGLSSDQMFRDDPRRRPENVAEVYEFGDLRLNIRERILSKQGTGERIAIPDKAFDTLCHLVRNAGRLVGKDELLNTVWAGSYVEENNLNKSIHAIRRAVGEKNGDKKYIETVKKHGFRFVADARAVTSQERLIEHTKAHQQPKRSHATVHEFPQRAARPETYGAPAAARHEPAIDSLSADPEGDSKLRTVRSPSTLPVSRSSARSRTLAFGAVLLVAIAVAGSLAYRYIPGPVAGASSAMPTMAVLPLKPVNAGARDLGLELAIADSLILKLNDSRVFQVSHLSTVRKFADLDADPTESGRELGVDYVLASNYQAVDGRIRVTSQLINVATGTTEKTFKSESTRADTFAMQDAVTNDIGNAVLANFGKPPTDYSSHRGTDNEEAVNLFYEAFYLIDKNTKDDSAKAADLLGKAVLLDPNYSQAWALRAQAYCQFAHRGGGQPDQLFTIAEPMLDKALTLDRDNATALLVRGVIDRDYHWKFNDAYGDFQRAIKADPDNWFAHRELAALYHHDGRFEDAVVEIKRTLELNPTNIASRWLLGLFQIEAGRRDEGVSELKRVIEMDPTFAAPYDTLWELYDREGDGPTAYQHFLKLSEVTGAKPDEIARLKSAYAKGGWHAVLRLEFDQAKAEDLKGEYTGKKYYIAELAALNGDRDAAFDYLEQSLRYRLIGMSWIKVDRRLDALRGDPRFQDIMSRTGISAG